MDILDEDFYKEHPALKLALIHGKLIMLNNIRELANTIIIRSNTNPFNPITEFEQGKVTALSEMLEGCASIEKALTNTQNDIIFDA